MMNHNSPEDSPAHGANPFADPGAPAPPAELDYEIVRLIGQGAYGDVWLARDREGSHFACKVVYRESFQHDRPYEREYEGIRKFEPVSASSESQVRILHVGRRDDAGYFYYLMELADDVQSGEIFQPETYTPRTLRSEIVQRKKLPVSECIQIGLSLTDALENLHGHGLIHRDIKPANIIFVRGVPKLADIGLVTDRDVTVSYVGTEGFIPPEGPKSAQADIYGLGKVLYEIATGKDRMDFPELPENLSDLPDRETLLELNAIIIKACETDPKKRYASAKDFHDDLALLSTGRSVRKIRASQRTMAWMARAVLVVLAAAVVGAGGIYAWRNWTNRTAVVSSAIIGTKIPWPAAHDVAESEAKLKDDYHAQLAAGPAPARQKAALEILERSSTTGDPAFEAASLRVAGLLAADAEDISLMTEICDKMEQRFEINVLPQKVELLQEAAAHARTPANKSDLADACLTAGFAAVAIDDYASATNLASLAGDSAAGANDSFLTQEATFLSEESELCRIAYESISADWKTFHQKPTDPKASLAVGKFLCFVKNDWTDGLPLLARGDDPLLKSVVSMEINGKVEDAQTQLALGNSWWNLAAAAPADDRTFYQTRARYWYLKGIANSAVVERRALREKLASRINTVPTDPGAIRIVSRVGGTEFVDIYSDEIQWKTGRRGSSGNKINQVNLGDFKPGGLEVIKNSGATWLLPANIDFSAAHIVADRHSRRQGIATLQIADDHVRVILAHPRLGESDIQVAVSFEKQP